MLEVLNNTQQTVTANGKVVYNTTSISDRANRMVLNDGNIYLNVPGKYKVTGLFNLYNSTSSAVDVTIQLYSNNNPITGAVYTVTVPATGYTELVIDKIVPVVAVPYGARAMISFRSSTGATITGTTVDVYKRT